MGLVSKRCVDFVKEFEGFYSEPYYDMVGVKTLGYGMTGKEIQGLTHVTETQASNMLEDLLNNKYAKPIKRDLDNRGITLRQNEFDALVSMAYNVGIGGVLGSTLYRDICNGVRDADIITKDFCMWCKAGGRVVNGLLRRRKREAQMFLDSPASNQNQVLDVQKAMNRMHIRDENGHVLIEDGINGGHTIYAVKRFQEIMGLSVDGIAGKDTMTAINQILSKPLCGRYGDSQYANRFIQWYVGSKIDGIFGNDTLEKVKTLQSKSKVTADGIVGKNTWAKWIG